VLRPSAAQWQDLWGYLAHESASYAPFGAVKVVPPEGWQARSSYDDSTDPLFRACGTQSVEGEDGVYTLSVEEGSSVYLSDLRGKCPSPRQRTSRGSLFHLTVLRFAARGAGMCEGATQGDLALMEERSAEIEFWRSLDLGPTAFLPLAFPHPSLTLYPDTVHKGPYTTNAAAWRAQGATVTQALTWRLHGRGRHGLHCALAFRLSLRQDRGCAPSMRPPPAAQTSTWPALLASVGSGPNRAVVRHRTYRTRFFVPRRRHRCAINQPLWRSVSVPPNLARPLRRGKWWCSRS
jgi:hypothetical protein